MIRTNNIVSHLYSYFVKLWSHALSSSLTTFNRLRLVFLVLIINGKRYNTNQRSCAKLISLVFISLFLAISILPLNKAFSQICEDTNLECIEPGGTRTVDNLEVHRDCWKYKYSKNCQVASANDCSKINHNQCNFAEDECLSKATIGSREFCLNNQKTFLCQWKEEYELTTNELIMDPDNKEAGDSLLCKAYCLDGNCQEAYKAEKKDNDEMVNSIAQLQMLRNVRNGLVDENSLNFNIFSGSQAHCNTKKTGYTKCCSDSGWAKSFGATCKAEEKKLARDWTKGLCIHLGEYCSSKTLGVCIVKKKVYCCYPTVLSKVIQIGARAQLNKSFGSAQAPQCGGLTIEELEKIDFSKIDFDEFFKREVIPNMNDYNSDDSKEMMVRAFPKNEEDKTNFNQNNKAKLEEGTDDYNK